MFPPRGELENYPDGLPIALSVRLGSRRISIKLGIGIIHALHEICDREGTDFKAICSLVAKRQMARETFVEALRVYVVNYFREAATPEGHRKAGHGKA